MNHDNTPREKGILYTRYPEAGKTKTRLIPELGEEGAANLQKRLTERICNRLKPLQQDGRDLEICFEGGSRKKMVDWLGPEWSYQKQVNGTLGERMRTTMKNNFSTGYDRIVIVGSDCPDLTRNHVRRAFSLLKNQDLVLGPALDGGYYLIGLSLFAKELFNDIPWGTKHVLENTLEKARNHNRSYELLETLSDIDRPGDLDDAPDV